MRYFIYHKDFGYRCEGAKWSKESKDAMSFSEMGTSITFSLLEMKFGDNVSLKEVNEVPND